MIEMTVLFDTTTQVHQPNIVIENFKINHIARTITQFDKLSLQITQKRIINVTSKPKKITKAMYKVQSGE